ncbi:hypothetical protein [Vibrio metschnikovii]|uniref:hypothetical protein n=1 Tax=Vibrio metschnikovii TaxID=28172 RepID=UPI001C2FBDAC|nr:hypothetical protein [Vibrio metschnikovii]
MTSNRSHKHRVILTVGLNRLSSVLLSVLFVLCGSLAHAQTLAIVLDDSVSMGPPNRNGDWYDILESSQFVAQLLASSASKDTTVLFSLLSKPYSAGNFRNSTDIVAWGGRRPDCDSSLLHVSPEPGKTTVSSMNGLLKEIEFIDLMPGTPIFSVFNTFSCALEVGQGDIDLVVITDGEFNFGNYTKFGEWMNSRKEESGERNVTLHFIRMMPDSDSVRPAQIENGGGVRQLKQTFGDNFRAHYLTRQQLGRAMEDIMLGINGLASADTTIARMSADRHSVEVTPAFSTQRLFLRLRGNAEDINSVQIASAMVHNDLRLAGSNSGQVDHHLFNFSMRKGDNVYPTAQGSLVFQFYASTPIQAGQTYSLPFTRALPSGIEVSLNLSTDPYLSLDELDDLEVGKEFALDVRFYTPDDSDVRPELKLLIDGAEQQTKAVFFSNRDDSRSWRAQFPMQFHSEGQYRIRVIAQHGGKAVQSSERHLTVIRPKVNISIVPVWSTCLLCEPARERLDIRPLPRNQSAYHEVLGIDVMVSEAGEYTLSLPGISLPGIALKLPDGRVLESGSAPTTLRMIDGARLYLMANGAFRPGHGRESLVQLSVAAPPPFTVTQRLSLNVRQPNELGLLLPADDWRFDIASGESHILPVSALMNGEVNRDLTDAKLIVKGLPTWAKVQQPDTSVSEWQIVQQLPWWKSPVFIGQADLNVTLELQADAGQAVPAVIPLTIYSSIPWWVLLLRLLIKIGLAFFVLIWLYGIWVKPRFGPNARIEYPYGVMKLSLSDPLRASFVNRWLIPFRRETASVKWGRFRAGDTYGHVYLQLPRGSTILVGGLERLAGANGVRLSVGEAVQNPGPSEPPSLTYR